jgi:hypothetical protein
MPTPGRRFVLPILALAAPDGCPQRSGAGRLTVKRHVGESTLRGKREAVHAVDAGEKEDGEKKEPAVHAIDIDRDARPPGRAGRDGGVDGAIGVTYTNRLG